MSPYILNASDGEGPIDPLEFLQMFPDKLLPSSDMKAAEEIVVYLGGINYPINFFDSSKPVPQSIRWREEVISNLTADPDHVWDIRDSAKNRHNGSRYLEKKLNPHLYNSEITFAYTKTNLLQSDFLVIDFSEDQGLTEYLWKPMLEIGMAVAHNITIIVIGSVIDPAINQLLHSAVNIRVDSPLEASSILKYIVDEDLY